MRRASGTIVATALTLALAGTICEAQLGRIWSPEKLLAESDIVILCEHLGTLPTGVRSTHPELTPGFPVVEVKSRLGVLALLKGTRNDSELSLRHYRPDWERLPNGIVNGGSELAFEKASGPYLVFMKQDSDGNLRPTTGYTFPDSSVMCLAKIGSRPPTR